MKIIQTAEEMIPIIKKITVETIKEIYPKYYPAGAVEFFLAHHSEEKIKEDVQQKIVYLLEDEGTLTGTVTVKENEINRLFVLPEFQGKGYGRELLSFAENKIWEKNDIIQLDASLPAKKIYQRRGYQETEYRQIKTENGDYLCYDVMVKGKEKVNG